MGYGKVYLVGAGPGSPDLITVKAHRLLRLADVILYDRLLDPEILKAAKVDAELIDVGKAAGRHKLSQEEINRLLIDRASGDRIVIRLKGGDPYVFGRGGEEALALEEMGIPFEVVPGVTSAISVPALSGIPVTHRKVATSFTVITGHEEPGKDNPIDWETLSKIGGTIVVLMGVGRLKENTALLLKGGRSPATPAAVVERGGYPDQRMVVGTLEDIAEKVEAADVKPPAILVVGDVVRLASRLAPVKVAFFRPENMIEESSNIAESMGFVPVAAPSIRLISLPVPDDIDKTIEKAECVLFTSSNGVDIAMSHPKIASALKGANVAAIGPKTAASLNAGGVKVSRIPKEFSSSGLVELLGKSCKSVLMLRSAQGSANLTAGLKEAGLQVTDVPIYEIIGSNDPRLDKLIEIAKSIDVFTFTSATTARYLIKRARELGREDELRLCLAGATVAVIGPPTAQELARLDVRVDVMPSQYTFPAMLMAVKEHLRARRNAFTQE